MWVMPLWDGMPYGFAGVCKTGLKGLTQVSRTYLRVLTPSLGHACIKGSQEKMMSDDDDSHHSAPHAE